MLNLKKARFIFKEKSGLLTYCFSLDISSKRCWFSIAFRSISL